MSLPQYEHFKFQVGDFVQPVSVNLDFGKQFKLAGKGPPILQVVERIYQECPGGVQLHYKVRPYFGEASGYARELDTFNEIELVAVSERQVEPPPADAT